MLSTRIWGSEAFRWIQENMPDLHKELCGLPSLDRCRRRLNEITGLEFELHDSISESLAGYLAKLKEMKREK